MVTLNKRQKEIVNFLGQKQEYITLNNISKYFDVSPRTIRNDLDSIEEMLKKNNIVLERRPKVGIRLVLKDDQYVEDLFKNCESNIYTSEDRVTLIILILILKNKVTIEELADELLVSKNTLVQDFKQVDIKLKEYNINVLKKAYHGIAIKGDEEEIRSKFLSIYSSLSYELKEEIRKKLIKKSKEDYSELKVKIEKIEEIMGTLYSQEAIEELEIIILLSKCRKEYEFTNKFNEDVSKRREFSILKDLLELKDKEIYYLLKIIDGARRTVGCEVNDITEEILDELCKILNLDCTKDIEFKSQITMHLKVAIHRIKNNLVIENPMLEEIKYKMQFIFKITEQILHNKEHILGVKFPEEEIAYMAMYFDAIFERNVKSNFSYKILVVCNGGLATSSLLKARINVMIPEVEIVSICRLRDVEKYLKQQDVDFIITTVPLKLEGYKVIRVNPLLDSEDTEKIKNEIFNKRYEKNCKYLIDAVKREKESKLIKLLPEEVTQFDIDINDWRQAIELAANPLVKSKKIKSSYIKKIINVVETLGNYMVFMPGIAFVHATPENVIENSISLLTLKNEIKFGVKNQVSIKAIVVLANKTENMNLVDLVDVLTKGDNITKFKNAKSYDDIKLLG